MCGLMKSPGERGPDGLWLYETRKGRGFTNAEAARAAVEQATGIRIAESVYAQYEAGTRPISPKHRVALIEFWGEPPATPQSDVASLVAAIGALTAALAKSEATHARLLEALLAELLAGAGIPSVPIVPTEGAAPGTGR